MDEKSADEDFQMKVEPLCAIPEQQDFNTDVNFRLEPCSNDEKDQPNIGQEALQTSPEENCRTDKLKSCLLDELSDANSAESKLDVGEYKIALHHSNENYQELLVKRERTQHNAKSSEPRIEISFCTDMDSEESDSDVEEHKIALQFLTGGDEKLCENEEPTAEVADSTGILVQNNVQISDKQYDVILKNAELIINDLYDEVNKNKDGIPEGAEGSQLTNASCVRGLYTCTCGVEFTRKTSYLKHLRLCHALGERTKRKYTCKNRGAKRHVDGRVGAKSSKFNNCDSTTSAQPLKARICTDAGGKSFRCNICSSKHSSKKRLELHVGAHENRNIFKCTICGYKCSQAESFKSHVHTHSDEKKSFKCNLCSYKCSQTGNLKAHAQTHTVEEPFKCYICDFKCTQARSLQSHIRTHTSDKTSFKCTICAYTCSCAGNLIAHVRTHTGEKPFKCNICDVKFSRAGILKRHILTHTGEKPFKCTICDFKCSQAGDLKRHIHTHTGEKPFKCTICDFKCFRSGGLKRHMCIHTGEKPFKCTICDFKCSQAIYLKTHVLTHTSEKPFKCTVCDFKYSRAGDLKRHMRSHTGEKPFKCTICDYRCADAGHLKAHARTHTDEKPFKCTVCEYKCRSSEQLKNHMHKHNGTRPYRCFSCEYQCTRVGALMKHIEKKHTK